MHLPVLILVAAASATSLTVLERDVVGAYPIVQILPVAGYNSTADGFNSLGSLYTNSSGLLAYQVNAIAQTNSVLSGSGSVQYDYDLKAGLASSLATVNNVFWQTAYQAEQKVCAITTSINQQNVDSVKGNLRAGIAAEAQAVLNIATTLTNTVAAIKSQASAFADSEKAVIAAVIRAIATAAIASVEPAATLSAGLTATGVTAINDVVQSLQGAVASLQAAADIQWEIS